MKTVFIKAALAATAMASLGLGATAANAATANAEARATILSPVVVTNTSPLDYGLIAAGAGASTVAVSTAGARTCGAGLVCTGATTAANFTVVGVVGQTVSVSVPANVTLSAGANNMTSTLVSSAPTIILDGTDGFSVGGTLSVGANQAAGAYTGNFTVTVNYQ